MDNVTNTTQSNNLSNDSERTNIFSKIVSFFKTPKQTKSELDNKMDYFHQHVYPFSLERKLEAKKRKSNEK